MPREVLDGLGGHRAMRPHEIANAARNERLARDRNRLLTVAIIAGFAILWLGLGYFGGALLQWAFPR